MKKIVLILLCVMFIASVAYAGAYDDAKSTADDTAYFDGGDGSLINSYEGSSSNVPDVGPSGPVD